MKPNMDYGLRPVFPEEIAQACGTARRAVEITGGDEAVALFYLNNIGLIPDAGLTKTITLSDFGAKLRALRDQQEEAKRQTERDVLAAEQKSLRSDLSAKWRPPVTNEERRRRYQEAIAPFVAADPIDHQARFLHGLQVQARLRAPKRTAKVLNLKERKRG